MLRHRLWNIDVVISQSVLFASLSAAVVGTYVATVGLLGGIVGRGTGAPVLATAIVALLVLPLHRRLQRLVNQLVHGDAEDPYAALTGADLLDIGGKVERIHLVEGDRGEDVLRTVDDPAVVRRVVDAVLAAQVLADDTRFDRMGNEATMFVRLDLADGTAVQRCWHVEAEVLAGHLEAPPALAETLAP